MTTGSRRSDPAGVSVLLKSVLSILLLSGGTLLGGGAALSADPPQGKARPVQALKGDAVCTRCHDESESKPILAIYQTRHGVKGDSRTPDCQSCHGVSDNHLKNKSTPPDVTFGKNKSEAHAQGEACLTCHKGEKRTHWNGSEHQNNDVTCSNCHTVHAAADKVLARKTQPEICYACHKEQRAQSLKISTHPIGVSKVACSDCHNPHGATGSKLLAKNTVTETCFTCHAEKRGPFLWEHQPVTEDCSNCHTPHGSNISPLLKSRTPFLCSECHDGPHHTKDPAAGSAAGTQGGLTSVPSENYTGRSCLHCHSMVHGSNHPAGALLHR